ncbi:hypothetical protein METSCH_D01760 [Metschnikowia aff. pulcherrima]|uniref:SANT domain-containing protein n=1 Tax=Metschnikowia aff. pulcherrima TaxID=2163413 RepID=A0A4P6XQX3_9ASCO|nr:hypothetical protein METSCH_D01760 [Metschnikowia aff. pulcherrima]
MSSSPRSTGPTNRFTGDSDYGKRRKSFYPASTRRDFKSTSNSPLTVSGTSASVLSSTTKPALRGDITSNSNNAGRSRPNNILPSVITNSGSSRQNSYSKDSRYAPHGSKHPYTTNYQHDRPKGAYGSFSSAKRSENESFAALSTSRDVSSRDMVNGSLTRTVQHGYSRDSWGRLERPKLQAAIGPSGSSRFNPNSIPLSSRSGLNSLSSSVSHDYKKERYEAYEDSSLASNSMTWNSFSSPKSYRIERLAPTGPTARFSTPKERIRSSGLTNSVGQSRRNDPYYPHKTYNAASRFNRDTNAAGSNEAKSLVTDPLNSREYGTKLGSNSSGISAGANRGTGSKFQYNRDYGESHDEGDEDDEDDEDQDEHDEEDEDDDGGGEDIKDKVGNQVLSQLKINLPEGAKISARTEICVSPISSVQKSDATQTHYNETMSSLSMCDASAPSLDEVADYPEGCTFPQSKLENEYQRLQLCFREDKNYQQQTSRFQNSKCSFENSALFTYNLLKFSIKFEDQLKMFRQTRRESKKRELSLFLKYKALSLESDKRRLYMAEQLDVLHPTDDEMRKELEAIDIRVKLSEPEVDTSPIEPPPPIGRRGRRHGDSVTTEAEFQEILKSLKNEQNEDPVARARHVAANIPDLCLDPIEKQAFIFMDSNNFVHDKSNWEERIKTDFDSNFTEMEHEVFCEAFCRSPKRFGEISRYMGGIRTFEECVMHYYITKKAVNYKLLVAQYKKKTTNKNLRRKQKLKLKGLSSEELEAAQANVYTDESHSVEDIQQHAQRKIKEVDEESSEAFEQSNSSFESAQPARKRIRLEVSDASEKLSESSKTSKPAELLPNPIASAISSENSRFDSQHEALHANPVSSYNIDGTSDGDERKHLKHSTSYWSINEVEDFPQLLNFYGSSWSIIAEKLLTKSTTMVKNYYQRNAEKFGWDQIVAAADMRLGHSKSATTSSAAAVDSVQQVTREAQDGVPNAEVPGPDIPKPSISSLLNAEILPRIKGKGAVLDSQRTNNLSSLLNAPSSPAPLPPASSGHNMSKRNNSIESLLG